jgi:methionine biosynthesis protein MetW
MATKRYQMPDPTVAVTDEIIKGQIEPGSRVIDLGCGDGRLLERLNDEHKCSVQGIEVSQNRILSTISRGVPVVQGDLDDGLPDVPDGSFDFAVLSMTLQQVRRPQYVLTEMLRVAHKALVVLPNFGHWRVRAQVVRYGRVPVTDSLPYEWYNTPNLHFMSLYDFRDLAARLNFRIIRELPIINGRAVDRAWAANLRAHSALYVLERGDS